MMKLRLGLVGLGESWDKRHRPALRALADRFEVRAVYEPVTCRAERVASEFGAAVVDGFRALARREDLDGILILDRGWYGVLPIFAACESGRAVYVATGFDLEFDAMRRIQHRVDRSGVAFMAELPRRLSPATIRLKELIATSLGPPRLVFCHQRVSLDEGPNHRADDRPASAVRRELVELVDWCRYVVGEEPRWVTGMTCCRDDYQMMSLDFSRGGAPGSGPVAQISCGRYIPSRWSEAVTYRPLAAMQILCERGIAFVDLPATLIWFDDAGRHLESLASERPVGERLLTQFHRAVTSLVSKTCNLEDACRALWIVEQAQASHCRGERIAL